MPKIEKSSSSKLKSQCIPGDKDGKLAFLYPCVMKYVSQAMRRLGMNFAVTGAAVGYEHKLSGAPLVITIALLDHDQLTSPKVIQDEVAALEFDSESLQLFRVEGNGRMYFSDPRVTTSGTKCIVKFLSVAALPPLAQIPYSTPHLLKSRHGWQATSPVLLVLDALIKAAQRVGKTARKMRKPAGLDPDDIDDKMTQKLFRRVAGLIQQLSPGTVGDQELLETQHKEAIPRLVPFIPEIASFAPFQPFLPVDKKNTKAGVLPIGRWKPVSEEKRHKPTRKRRSLRWVAQQAISALQGRGFSSALYGDIAKDLYGDHPCPDRVDLVVYVPSSGTPQPGLEAIRKIIMEKDPPSFYLCNPEDKDSVEQYLFYRPTAAAHKRMGFKFAGFDRYGCRINFVLPPEQNLEPLSATTRIMWVDSLPVVPLEILG